MIDDLSESNINQCFGCEDRLALMDVDAIAGAVRLIESAIGGEPAVLSQLERFCLHPDFKKGSPWVGTTVDLKSAYKQIHVRPDQAWTSCIVAYDPNSKQPRAFAQSTLPFGSSASVLAFNRASRAVWYLGCKLLDLCWLNFFDDYPTLTVQELSKSTMAAAHLLLALLGWDVSGGDKQVDFAQMFNALGVSFEIGRVPEARSVVFNSAKRSADMIKMMEEVLTRGTLSLKEVEVIRGKLQFMEAQAFGKIGKSLLRKLLYRRTAKSQISDQDRIIIQDVIAWLKFSLLRVISPPLHSRPLLVFTDGACEPGQDGKPLVTCGGVLIDPNDEDPKRSKQLFGFTVRDDLVQRWLDTGKRQLVTEAELYAVVTAVHLWADRIKGARVLLFVDSEPAMYSLIRGTSDIDPCAELVHEYSRTHARVQSFVWFVRIPSKSNPADAPSRLQLNEAASELGASIINAVQPDIPNLYTPLFANINRGDEGKQSEAWQ